MLYRHWIPSGYWWNRGSLRARSVFLSIFLKEMHFPLFCLLSWNWMILKLIRFTGKPWRPTTRWISFAIGPSFATRPAVPRAPISGRQRRFCQEVARQFQTGPFSKWIWYSRGQLADWNAIARWSGRRTIAIFGFTRFAPTRLRLLFPALWTRQLSR